MVYYPIDQDEYVSKIETQKMKLIRCKSDAWIDALNEGFK